MQKNEVTAPTVEPITTAEAKSHNNIDHSDDDTLIDGFIKTARRMVERYTNLVLVTQTWDIYFNSFPETIYLPLPPLQSVTSITYVDTAGTSQTLSASLYQVDTVSKPARIRPAYGQSWPSTRQQMQAVVVRIVCGYAPDSSSPQDYRANIPQDIKDAIAALVGDLYENREGFVTVRIQDNDTVTGILGGYRVRMPVQ